MGSAVSSGTIAFLSLFVVCSMVAGATGIMITTTAADGPLEEASGTDTSPSDIDSSFDSTDSIDDDSIDDTADSLEEGADETSETVDESADEPTNGDDETVTETSDAIDETSTDATEAVDGTSDGTNDTTTDSVDDPIDSVNETTEAVQNATNETTGGLDERVDETSEPLEDIVDETTDGVDDVTNGTADEADSFLEEPIDLTTDALESAAGGAADTISSPISTVASVQIPGTDGSLSSVADGESVLGAVAGGAPTDPGTGKIAADAVLVGLMGAMTASAGAAGGIGGAGGAIASAGAAGGAGAGAASGAGAAASSGLAGGASGAGAAGGAGGASGGGLAGGASNAVANWSASGRRSLRRALEAIPWELIPILKYSRYDDSDPLENETRNAIYETLEADPGRYLSQISDEIDVPLSTVRHHVRVLEEEGLLTTVKINGKRRYYLEEIDSELQAALEEPAKRDVLEALATLERANNSELAAELDRDPSTVTHHLSTLEDDDLVIRERDGRSIVNELAPETSAALFEEENTTLEDPSPQAPAD